MNLYCGFATTWRVDLKTLVVSKLASYLAVDDSNGGLVAHILVVLICWCIVESVNWNLSYCSTSLSFC